MITKRQREVLTYIEGYTAKHGGVSPSYEEIAAACGMRAKSHVCRLIEQLEERGRIVRLKYRARALRVVGPTAPVAIKPKPKPYVRYTVANAEFWIWNDHHKCLDRWFAKK